MKIKLLNRYQRILIIVFFIYSALLLYLIFLGFGITQSNIDYKNFSTEDSCMYSLNQFNFYDMEQENKIIEVSKEYLSSIFNFHHIECVNKVIGIQDGWPELE